MSSWSTSPPWSPPRHLEAIRARVDAAGARLVLTGDPYQLGPIEAGGAMGLLDGHAETYTLTEVRRFTHDWERAASLALRKATPPRWRSTTGTAA